MVTSLNAVMLKIPLPISDMNNSRLNNNVTFQITPMDSNIEAVTQNTSFQDGCLELTISEMEYLPWDNPDNIVSAEVEGIFHRVMVFVLVFMFLIGGPGNVINMAVFYKQGLKDRVNLCLFALSLADLLYLITSMFFHSETVHLQFTTKEYFGPIHTFMTNYHVVGFIGFMYVSPVLTAIIASERCYCVLRPLKYQTVMRTRTMAAIIIIVFVMVVGAFFIVAIGFSTGCVRDAETGVTTKTDVEGEFYRNHKKLIDSLNSFVYGVGLPGVVLIVVTTTTLITIVKLRQIVTWRAGTSSSVSPREVALTKMLVGTSILFIVCVLPFAVTRFSWLFLPELNSGGRNHNFFLTSLWINFMLTYINSSVNIIVYYVMGTRYRETFWGLFSRKGRSKKH